MIEQAVRTWLSSRHELDPALETYHRQAPEILEVHSKTGSDQDSVNRFTLC